MTYEDHHPSVCTKCCKRVALGWLPAWLPRWIPDWVEPAWDIFDQCREALFCLAEVLFLASGASFLSVIMFLRGNRVILRKSQWEKLRIIVAQQKAYRIEELQLLRERDQLLNQIFVNPKAGYYQELDRINHRLKQLNIHWLTCERARLRVLYMDRDAV